MAVTRDPAFWRRFSMAVHQDEEKHPVAPNSTSKSPSPSSSSSRSQGKVKIEETWLERNARKRRQSHLFGWLIALGFTVVICALVLVLLWYLKAGPWKRSGS